MSRCAGKKRDGSQCTTIVGPSHTHCYQHDPDRAIERQRNARKAAKSKPSREVHAMKSDLKNLTDRVLSGEVETGRASVANQIINTRLRAIEVERRIREQDNLEARLIELERAAELDERVEMWRA